MLDSLQKRKESGFTIVEVMIVLAIAGLIILIVFLAVPALQRNSRNTQRSNDVTALLGGVAEIQAANNGSLSTLTSATLTATAPTGYYQGTGTGVGAVNVVSGAATLTTGAADDRVVIATGAKCGTGTTANQAIPGPARGVVALYQIETSGNPMIKCQAS